MGTLLSGTPSRSGTFPWEIGALRGSRWITRRNERKAFHLWQRPGVCLCRMPGAKAVPRAQPAASHFLMTPGSRSLLAEWNTQEPNPSPSLPLMPTCGTQLRFLITEKYYICVFPSMCRPHPSTASLCSRMQQGDAGQTSVTEETISTLPVHVPCQGTLCSSIHFSKSQSPHL